MKRPDTRNLNPALNFIGAFAIGLVMAGCGGGGGGDALVDPKVASVAIASSDLILSAGESSTVTAIVTGDDKANKTVVWTSSAPGIATVTQTGVIQAIAAGSALITATSNHDGSKKSSVTVTVTATPVATTSVDIFPDNLTLVIGDSATLTATVKGDSATDKTVIWTTNAPGIASVAADGVVTAKAVGSTTITAISNHDVTRRDSITITVTEAAPPGSAAYNTYSPTLPSWRSYSPSSEAIDAPVEGKDATREFSTIDGVMYGCTSQEMRLTTNPSEIVTFNPDVSALWAGSLLQGKTYLEGIGSLAELPIRERAPITIFIDKLGPEVTKTVNNPTAATIQQATSDLINAIAASGVPISSSIHFNQTTAYSAEQAAMSMGLSARYASAKFNANFSTSLKANESQVNAHFVQELFTVAVVSPQTPGEFFTSAFTKARLDQQVALGRLGPDNLPVYVASITYGRILNFTMTSTASEATMKRIIKASYDGVEGGVSASLTESEKKVLEESEIKVTAIGGDADAALALIRSGNLKDYFAKNAPLTTARPISYEIHNIGDESNATFSETTNYTLRQCSAGEKETTTALARTLYVKGNRDWGGVGTPDSERRIYTLPSGSYYLKTHTVVNQNGKGICRFEGYSNEKTFTRVDGTTVTLPTAAQYYAYIDAPSSRGSSQSTTCVFTFDVLNVQ